MSDNRQLTLWGMKPRNPSLGGDNGMMKRFSKYAAILAVALAIFGFSLPAFAQVTSFPNQPEHGCWGGDGMPIGACEWPESFDDVDPSSYAAQAIEIARHSGIMVGNNDQDFQGERALTREEAAIIVSRLLDYQSGGQISLNLEQMETVLQAANELRDLYIQQGRRLDFLEAWYQNLPTDEEFARYQEGLHEDLGVYLERSQAALLQQEEWISNEIRNMYAELADLRNQREGDPVALARIEQLEQELLDEITVAEALEVKLDERLSSIDGVLLGIARQVDDLGLRQDDFERMLNQMRAENGDFVTTSTLDAELEGYVTTTVFEADQARQDDEIAALWDAINALIHSGSASSITVSGQLDGDNPLAQPDCGLWFSATDNKNREITLATHRNYSGDMSVQFGRYADVNFSGEFPGGWNTGQESSVPGEKETRWYASALPTNSTLTAVASYGSATCTVTWDVYHR